MADKRSAAVLVGSHREESFSRKLEDFRQFMKRRADVARAYVNGDGAPLEGITAHSGAATFFPPMGGFEHGAEAVTARYQKDVRAFTPGGETSFEVLQVADDIAFWAGFQTAKVKMQGANGAREMKLRVTEVFRRIGGEWKIVHRHADMLTEPQTPK